MGNKFKRKSNPKSNNKSSSKIGISNIEIMNKPKICCIDVRDEIINPLKELGFNIYKGSLGDKIRVPNTEYNNHEIKIKFDLPSNLHEYDIIILDLDNDSTIDYIKEDHIPKDHRGNVSYSLLSTYPETIFDPKPYVCKYLAGELEKIRNRPYMLLTFTAKQYEIEYEFLKTMKGGNKKNAGGETIGIYSFSNTVYPNEDKYGEEIKVSTDIGVIMRNFLESYLDKTVYNQTFNKPSVYKNGQWVKDDRYKPLIRNSSDEIVSFAYQSEHITEFYFPQINLKGEFLKTFLTQIAPNILPGLFPSLGTFSWKENEEYWLPNQRNLLAEKKRIEDEFDEKLRLIRQEIDQNKIKYAFLHNIITETGDKLVDELITYFKWLGFKNVIKVDEKSEDSKVLEEDIQIELENGLLIIECKGIGGTSTDSDCNQISKIKHRRCKERNKFDVYALYIVNHQRYLPPLSRQNPPFSNEQIQDAENDERGLLTTWQLFNLYYYIEEGIIDKKFARDSLLNIGFIDFRPGGMELIGVPKEILKDGEVCIVNLNGIELNIEDTIIIEKNEKFQLSKIQDIQVNDKTVKSVNSGEVGLKLSIPIKKKSKIWKKSD